MSIFCSYLDRCNTLINTYNSHDVCNIPSAASCYFHVTQKCNNIIPYNIPERSPAAMVNTYYRKPRSIRTLSIM